MKKFLSLFLAVLMVVSVVAMTSVFTVSAAESTLDTTNMTEYESGFAFWNSSSHGFVDGYFTPKDEDTYAIRNLLGVDSMTRQIFDENVKIYVDGVQVFCNVNHSNVDYGGGFGFGIPSVGYTAGQTSTFTVVVADTWFTQATFTPNTTAHRVISSATTKYTESRALVSVVTFETLPSLAVGDTLELRFHDECSNTAYTSKVQKIDGTTVTVLTENISSNKTLCEYALEDGTKFSVSVTEEKTYVPTFSAAGYVQFRPNENTPFDAFDVRVLAEVYEPYITGFTSAKIQLTITNGDVSKSFAYDTTTVYQSIRAGNEIYTAEEDRYYFGVAVTGIPTGVTAVSASLVFTADGNETVVELGSLDVNNPYANLEEQAQNVASSGNCLGIEQQTVSGIQTNVFTYGSYSDIYPYFETLGGSLVMNINGVNYLITTVGYYADWTSYGRIAIEFTGFKFVEGEEYTVTLYVFDANYNMVYCAPTKTFTSTVTTTYVLGQNVKLPASATKVDYKKIINIVGDGNFTPYGSETVDKMFDGNTTSTKLCCYVGDNPSFTVFFETSEETTLTYYTLWTGSDTASSTHRNPESWVLYGKVNEDEWVVLSSIAPSDDYTTGLMGVNSTAFTYKVTNKVACTEYKIEFTEESSQFQLNEIELYQ